MSIEDDIKRARASFNELAKQADLMPTKELRAAVNKELESLSAIDKKIADDEKKLKKSRNEYERIKKNIMDLSWDR